MTEARYDHDLCGWRVRSAIALPELAPWEGEDREPDLTIEVGPVPATLDSPTLSTPVLQLDAAGRGRFHVAPVATFLIEGGHRITIDPHMPIDSPDIRLFLLGTPYGLICHQRGLVPLHASSVEVDGEALLFSGVSGAGKSTLAAAFWRRGHRLLSDDVAPVQVGESGALVLPGIRRVRLWQDSIAAAGWDSAVMEPCRPGLPKFSQKVEGGFVTTPLKPRALFHLARQAEGSGEASFERLRGRAAVQRMTDQVYRLRTMSAVASQTEGITRIARVSAAIPHHFVFSRPVRFDDLDRQIDVILDTVRGVQGQAA